MCNTNLYHENSIDTTDDDSSKAKIIQSVKYGMYDYLRYIEKSIEVIQNQGAIKIPLKRVEIEDEVKFHLDIDDLNDKEAERINTELFEREVRYVYSGKLSGDKKKDSFFEIKIIDRNEGEKYLILDTDNELEFIYLKANDYQLQMQKNAVNALIHRPKKEHTAIQKLFDLSWKAEDYFEGNYTPLKYEPDWQILTDNQRDGNSEQQEFVRKALQTDDFALLEGPPGSGKTTAIIELIIQLINQGKRILLVSATHVAVDNVIHRILTTYKQHCESLVVPIRISADKGSIRKESVEPYRLQTFIKSTKNQVRNNLSQDLNSKSKKMLYDSLIDIEIEENGVKKTVPNRIFDDIILKSANLIGGTMIGILQHPDIKKGSINEMFDVMIVDEASKVTFLDFLVPALYAKKWILVGDVNQLSPYTEDDFINENIDETLKDTGLKEKLIKEFSFKQKLTSDKQWNKESLKILFSDNRYKEEFPEYETYKLNEGFEPNPENILKLNSADIVICKPTKQNRKNIANYVYVKSMIFEEHIEQTNFQNRQNAFHKNKGRKKVIKTYPFEFNTDMNQEWSEMVGSRLSQMYQYRFEPKLKESIKQEFDFLVPDEITSEVDKIRKIALPSILELLQIGIGETISKSGQVQNKLIYEGFKQFRRVTNRKFQSLTYQHRMHDEIASIPREYFYTENNNLKTSNKVIERTDILNFYKPDENKVIWVSNKDVSFSKKRRGGMQENVNPTETNQIKRELENFISKAKHNHKENNENYEIAVLTFYRAQERELRKMLKKLSGQHWKNKHFLIENVEITLSTVDRFQGDEADMVLLSFTKFSPKAFYNSPNRLNVALTRARYKLVLFGNKNWLAKNAQLEALRKLAEQKEERISTK